MQVSPMSQTYMFTGLAVTVGALTYAWKTQQSAKSASDKEISRENPIKITILYGTQFGTSKRFARRLLNQAKTKLPVNAYFQLKRMDQFDPEDLAQETIFLCVVSTVEGGKAPANAKFFCNWVAEAVNDWRVHDSFLSKVRFAVFGCCNTLYEDNGNCNVAGRNLYENLTKIGAKPLSPLGVGDANIQRIDSKTATQETDFKKWVDKLMPFLENAVNDPTYFPNPSAFKTKRKRRKVAPVSDTSGDHDLLDIESLGAMVGAGSKKQKTEDDDDGAREMITPVMREKLTKEGYKLLGTHSAVKLCRWTKAMLRGRGGCYKHTFYGIISYQCMETTPNLACANRCVFCWRHHTNPVGKEWRWVTDKPGMILDQAMSNHYKSIHGMKDAPGVTPERYADAHRIRHCALSLVGEPIMYPYIQEFLDLLHKKDISTFLVTNAQFPDRLKEIGPVTQLYISIDAATKDSLKAVDRPLFQDFWQRFLDSMDALKIKQQRTVYRLTLVKTWNMQELADYAALVARGMPSFIEIKGVTFCGKSDGYAMEMGNVPWHEEVRHFCQKLASYLSDDYELACEHKHSCCVLLARKEYKVNGKWHTWIDFDKFSELLRKGEPFNEFDYMAQTPDWAVWGAEEAGFNPEHTWVRKERKLRKRAQDSLNAALAGIENDPIPEQLEHNSYVEAKKELGVESTAI